MTLRSLEQAVQLGLPKKKASAPWRSELAYQLQASSHAPAHPRACPASTDWLVDVRARIVQHVFENLVEYFDSINTL